MARETNIHAGHRGSMRRKYMRVGADAFLPHELLEIMLYYGIHMHDTNPTAHRLLDTLGTLEDVFEASDEQLLSITGIGEHVLALIRLVREVGRRTERSYLSSDTGSSRTLDDFVLSLSTDEDIDVTRLILLDSAGRLLAVERISDGTILSPAFEARRLIEPAIRHRASIAVLCTYPRNRSLRRGGYDYEATASLRDAFSLVGVRLAEHYVVTSCYAARLSRSIPECLSAEPDVTLIFREGKEGVDETVRQDAARIAALLEYAGKKNTVSAQTLTELICTLGGTYRLMSSPIPELIRRGIPERAAILLSLTLALYVRSTLMMPRVGMRLNTADKLGEHLARHYLGVTGERVLLLLLDGRDQVIRAEFFAEGTVDGTPMEIRRIVELALLHGAASVVLAHNHPAGTLYPSPEDEQATVLLAEALDSVGVPLVEHYVIAAGSYTPIRLYSMRLATLRPPEFYGKALMARVADLCFGAER